MQEITETQIPGSMSEARQLSDEDIRVAIVQEVTWADEESSRASETRERALAYYWGREPGLHDRDYVHNPDNCADLSEYISTDVADAVDSVLAEIMPAFSGEAPVEFVPLGPEDEAQASLESDAVNHVASNNGAYLALHQACRDALLLRAGVVKVYWEERDERDYHTYRNVPEQQAVAGLQQLQQQYPDPDDVEILDAEQMDGVSATVRIKRRKTRPRIDSVPLDEFLISANTAAINIDEVRFCAHRRPMTRSELVEIGGDQETVANLTAYNLSGLESGRARAWDETRLDSAHESTELVLVAESYYRIDKDGDGVAELRRIITAGGSDGTDVLLQEEPWDCLPFCVGNAYLGVHSWEGISLFDKLRDTQQQKTELMREIRNLVRRASRQRTKVRRGAVDMPSLMSSQIGGIVTMDDPATDAIPYQEVTIPPLLMEYLGMLDTQRREKGGGAIDRASQAMAISGDTAHGIERVMSASEARNAMIARNLAETLLKPLYRKLHKLMRQYMQEPLMLPGSAGWRATRPVEWSPREHMAISMGMSVGERTRRSAALQAILQIQAQDAQMGQGEILGSNQARHQARRDFARMAGLPNPDQYWRDPESPEAQQAMQAAQQAQQQQIQQQIEQAQQQMQFQYSLMTDIEKVKAEAKLQTEQMKTELERTRMVLDQAQKLFGHRVELAKTEAEINQVEGQQAIDLLQAKARRETQR